MRIVLALLILVLYTVPAQAGILKLLKHAALAPVRVIQHANNSVNDLSWRLWVSQQVVNAYR